MLFSPIAKGLYVIADGKEVQCSNLPSMIDLPLRGIAGEDGWCDDVHVLWHLSTSNHLNKVTLGPPSRDCSTEHLIFGKIDVCVSFNSVHFVDQEIADKGLLVRGLI
jgi:hypothetical protein